MEILIFAEAISPRLSFVVAFVFEEQLGLATQCTDDWARFISSDAKLKINFSNRIAAQQIINILPENQILFEKNLDFKNIERIEKNISKILDEKTILGNDFFSPIFFFLSRYEECFSEIPRESWQKRGSLGDLINYLLNSNTDNVQDNLQQCEIASLLKGELD